jgi:hypothetical protein
MGVRSFSRKSNIILSGAPRDLRIALSERWPQSFAAPQPADARLRCCRKIQQDAISRRLMFCSSMTGKSRRSVSPRADTPDVAAGVADTRLVLCN